jgi:hypothetical protein
VSTTRQLQNSHRNLLPSKKPTGLKTPSTDDEVVL